MCLGVWVCWLVGRCFLTVRCTDRCVWCVFVFNVSIPGVFGVFVRCLMLQFQVCLVCLCGVYVDSTQWCTVSRSAVANEKPAFHTALPLIPLTVLPVLSVNCLSNIVSKIPKNVTKRMKTPSSSGQTRLLWRHDWPGPIRTTVLSGRSNRWPAADEAWRHQLRREIRALRDIWKACTDMIIIHVPGQRYDNDTCSRPVIW